MVENVMNLSDVLLQLPVATISKEFVLNRIKIDNVDAFQPSISRDDKPDETLTPLKRGTDAWIPDSVKRKLNYPVEDDSAEAQKEVGVFYACRNKTVGLPFLENCKESSRNIEQNYSPNLQRLIS